MATDSNSLMDDSIPIIHSTPFTDHYYNPFYLSPGENLSTPIVTVKLKNDNFHLRSHSSLISYDSAAAVWKDLKHRFSQCGAIIIADLQARIASCDQGDSSVTQYFTDLKVLREEYLQYRPIPNCDAVIGRVDLCAVAKRVSQYQDQDYSIRFIRGLNDRFDMARESGGSSSSSSSVFAGLTAGQITPSQSVVPVESVRPSTGGAAGQPISSFSAEELVRLLALLQQAESAFPTPSPSNSGTFALTSLPSFSDMTNHHWIIDTGAINHIICSISNFSTYQPLAHTHVTLPTGNHVSATHIGSVSLDCGLTLPDVLYIQNFSFNLLSVSKLTSKMPISFVFSGSQCHI
ncbi:hypothetical protein LINPERPRIM_LOCUS31386 [Linum perenne]